MVAWAFGTEPLETFIWFAEEDLVFLEALEKHLSPLAHVEPVTFWHSGMTPLGENVKDERQRRIRSAELYLVLVSSDLLASEKFVEEVDAAFVRMDQKQATIVPIIVRACDWKSTALGVLTPLPPPNGSPVAVPLNDTAWLDVVTALRSTLKEHWGRLNET